MNFENTKYNISVLEESGQPIYAEDLYNLLGLLVDDALRSSRVVDSSSLQCQNKSELALAVKYILSDALKVYLTHQDGITALSSQTQQELSRTAAEAEIARTKLQEVCSLVKSAEEKRTLLQAEKADIEDKNGRLLQVQAECDALAKRIAELNDSSLDGMEERLLQLKEDASKREARAHQLETDTARLNREAEAQQTKLDAALRENAAATASVQELNTALEKANRDIAGAESKRAELSDLLASLRERNTALLDASAQYAETFNAINAVINDPFVCKNIFSDTTDAKHATLNMPGSGDKISSPSELKAWMENMEQSISQLLSVYQDALRRVVNLGETLTNPTR